MKGGLGAGGVPGQILGAGRGENGRRILRRRRRLLSENPLRYELAADRQRWLGAREDRAIYAQIAS